MGSNGLVIKAQSSRGTARLSPMLVSQLHPTMSFTEVMESVSAWPVRRQKDIASLFQRCMGRTWGQWEVPFYGANVIKALGGIKRVPAKCRGCDQWYVVLTASLQMNKSKGCRDCAARPRVYTDIPTRPCKQLQERYNALTERIKANKKSSRTYAGVENHFTSAQDFVYHIWRNWPMEDYKGYEVDRVDTRGPYSKENVRLVTRVVNAQTRKVNRVWSVEGALVSSSALQRMFFPELHKSTVMIWHRDGRDIPYMVERYSRMYGISSMQDRAIALHAAGLLFPTAV